MLHAVEDLPPEPKVHVMHDFESWALKSAKPCLISLGGVKFTGTTIVDSFHVRIDPADCQRFGLEIEAETVEWWMHNDRQAARDQLEMMGKVDLYAALDGYNMWLGKTPANQLGSAWSNGSNFDNARLKEIYRIIGLEWPFSYEQEECYRTMKNRFPEVPFERLGVHHGALDDAQSQAVHLQVICRSHLIAL
jgi:hypothetical protein